MNTHTDSTRTESVTRTEDRVQQLELTCDVLRRQLEEAKHQLQQVNKISSVGQMVATVAHELNNPLNGVLGFAQLMIKRTEDDKDRRDLQRIESEAKRATKIVNTLLTFVREHSPEQQMVNINDIMSSMVEMREHHRMMHHVDLVLEMDSALPETIAEAHQIGQVILNLVSNAEQAIIDSGTRGTIHVSSTLASDGTHPVIRITIQDTGPGMSPDVLLQIFEPFFTTRSNGDGTGLGLAICKQIAEDHNGTLSVDSREGFGTTFTLDLPVTIEEEGLPTTITVPAPSATSVPSSRGLVIDDEMVVREFVEETFTSEGHQIDTVENGRQAFEAIKNNKYDFIICDLKMPEVNGQTFYDVVKNFDNRLSNRIIFITGDTASLETEAFVEGTGNYYMYKPFQLDDLIAMVNRVILENS